MVNENWEGNVPHLKKRQCQEKGLDGRHGLNWSSSVEEPKSRR